MIFEVNQTLEWKIKKMSKNKELMNIYALHHLDITRKSRFVNLPQGESPNFWRKNMKLRNLTIRSLIRREEDGGSNFCEGL